MQGKLAYRIGDIGKAIIQFNLSKYCAMFVRGNSKPWKGHLLSVIKIPFSSSKKLCIISSIITSKSKKMKFNFYWLVWNWSNRILNILIVPNINWLMPSSRIWTICPGPCWKPSCIKTKYDVGIIVLTLTIASSAKVSNQTFIWFSIEDCWD